MVRQMDKMRLHKAFERAGAANDEAEVMASTIVEEVEGGMSSAVDEMKSELTIFSSEVRQYVDKMLFVGVGLTIFVVSIIFLIMQYFLGQGQ